MGILDIFSTEPEQINSASTIDVGREAFKYFHNHASRYDAYENKTMNEALAIVSRYGRPYVSGELDLKVESIFLDGFGFAILELEHDGLLEQSGVIKVMEDLADKAEGKLPTANSFFNAIKDKASNPSYIDIAKKVIPDVANQVVQGAAAVGESVIETGKWLTGLLPFLVVGAVVFVVYSKSKRIAG